MIKKILNDKKIPWVPPVFHDNKFVIDFREKAELFSKQYSNIKRKHNKDNKQS